MTTVVTYNYGQSSFELTGLHSFGLPNWFSTNMFESNTLQYNNVRDWHFSVLFGSEFSGKSSNTLYTASFAKRLQNNFFTFRYTPGYHKEFFISGGESIVLDDSSRVPLQSHFQFQEVFGAGYSYRFSSSFDAGFSLRYFTQKFEREKIGVVFSDSLYLFRESSSEFVNTWRLDAGIRYRLTDQLALSISTINLLTVDEQTVSSDNESFTLKKEKGITAGITYSPIRNMSFDFLYESSNSFTAAINSSFQVFGGNGGFSLTIFSDSYQDPFIAGMIPSLSYSTNFYNVTLSGVKYLSDRNATITSNSFFNEGIHNIINNRYSFDKIVLSVNVALNTIKERYVEFTDVEIIKDIFPSFYDEYSIHPFAIAQVVNISNKPVNVKPSSRINKLNDEVIHSPSVKINPKDTAAIPFYTIIPGSYENSKAVLSYADFYITTEYDSYDDEFQKPLLIQGINNWDGRVINLRYFVARNIEYSMNYAKQILQQYKPLIDTVPSALLSFHKAKILFEHITSELVYVADPRASVERVQFPKETVTLKGGDCDDLSVLYSSLLESVGIQTAFVDYKSDDGIGHVKVLLNTGLMPGQSSLITSNDKKYIIRKNISGNDEIWIPIETTELSDFENAWEIASQRFYNEAVLQNGLSKGRVEIVDVY